ncbi:MAG: hypothetical protein J1D77_03720 [Muribaculaceae bacterium]|nr:hypothetical protein [Muribaculaceae bacterium]
MAEEEKDKIGYAAAHQGGYVAPLNDREEKGGNAGSEAVKGQTGNAGSDVAVNGQTRNGVLFPEGAQVKVDPGRHADEMGESGEDSREMDGIVRAGQKKILTLQDAIDRLKAPESAEDRAKREKKERSKRIIGALSDGLRSLGNLYYTSQYAPDMYKGSTSQLERTNQWIEKMRAEREKEEEAYNNLTGKLADAEGELAKNVNDLRARQEARRLAREEAARKEKMFGPQYAAALAKADGAGYDAQRKKVAAEAAPEQERLKAENLAKKGKVYESQEQRNRAATAASGRSNPYQYRAWDKDGKPHYFAHKDAAEMFAKQEGTDVWEEVNTTVTERQGKVEKKKTTTKEQVVPGKPKKKDPGADSGTSGEKSQGKKKDPGA